MAHQQGKLNSIRHVGSSQVVVFIHGFSGDRDDTWDRFPLLLGTHLPDWDIYTLGYATTMLPDVAGVWSADPDLPIIATMLRTHFGIAPLDKYKSIALVGHSMGGLVVQKALVDGPELRARTSHVVFFGTPSGGLQKTSWIRFLKPQMNNMTKAGPFITRLREDWAEKVEPSKTFRLMVVAGSKDQFVPPTASLEPFGAEYHYVVPGDHLAIVKPKDGDDESVRLLVSALATHAIAPKEARDPLTLAAERPGGEVDVIELVEAREDANEVSEAWVVDMALALERAGHRGRSIKLLEKHADLGPDIQGTLGGRMKRIWLETEDTALAERAFDFYGNGLSQAQAILETAETDDEQAYAHGQIYYHAINRAFLHFVAFDQPDDAARMADLAVEHAEASAENVWSVATLAEAHLYKGRPAKALDIYRRMLDMRDGEPWQHASVGQQASVVASKLRNEELAESLARLFTPQTRKSTKVFVSYSHDDKDWADRLQKHAKPWLRKHEEIDLWVDTRIKAGDMWHDEIQRALAESGVAVALVSANFLASDYIWDHELPEILRAAEDRELRLLWAYVSHGAVDATTLQDFQAAHDTERPLADLSTSEQEKILTDIAREIKKAALSATEQYKA